MNQIILLEFLRNSISMKIESHQTEPEKEKNSTKMCMVLESAIYMVQYASFRKFCSNTQNFQNFDLVVLFIVMHHMCFYISINSRKILWSYRMRGFFPFFSVLGEHRTYAQSWVFSKNFQNTVIFFY